LSNNSLVGYITQRLIEVGFRPVVTPFTVASVRFDFVAALQGKGGRSSDLVLLVDTSLSDGPSKIGERTRQKLEALSRALDIAGSNLVLTVVLAGASLPPSTVELIARRTRVLVVPIDPRLAAPDQAQEAALDFLDRLRILMPLELGADADTAADPLGKVIEVLPTDELKSFGAKFVAQSARGERAVELEVKGLLEEQLSKGLPQ
jgi:hypothetical protein